jgi:hypothetical protein
MAMANLCKFRGKAARTAALVVMIGMGLMWPVSATAQSSVGAGPLTSTLADVEPTVGILSVGPVRFAPGLTIREIGWDSNVFDEPPEDGPKDDFVVALQPDLSVYTRLRFVRLSAYTGAELQYYNTYESERSVGHAARVRADFLLSRVRPFAGVGNVETRTRPNGEIDTRVDRQERELSGGLAFDLSPYSLVYGSAYHMKHDLENALEDGVDVGRSLSRETSSYQGGIKTDITPLLSVQLFASHGKDRFTFEPIRDAESWAGSATFGFDPNAFMTGTVTVSYRDMKFADPGVRSYRGFVGNAALIYPFLEIGRISVLLTQGVEYSFDAAEAYFVQRSATVAYTHRLFGNVDAQIGGTWASFDYDARESVPSHTDSYQSVVGSVGYNLRNRTRIAVNYEDAHRRSPALAERNYERRRAFLSWQFAF